MKFFDFFGPKSPPIEEVHSLPLPCVSYLHDQEKKPIVDHLRGDVKLLPLMDSRSCGSYLHDQEKKPIVDHLRVDVKSLSLMDSRSCGSYLHDQGKKPIVDHLRGDVKSLPLMDSRWCGSSLQHQEKKPIVDHLRGDVKSLPLMDSRSRGSYLQHQEKKPIVDHLRGDVKLLPLMDSRSCGSFLHDQEKKPTGDHSRGDVKLLPLMDSRSCGSFLHDQERKPTGDHPRGKVHLPSLMNSWSRSSYLHNQEKSRDREFRETSSAKVVVARKFFPLTPDLNGFLGTKKLGDPCQKIARAHLRGDVKSLPLMDLRSCGSYLHDQEKKHNVDHLRGDVKLLPLMDSRSCGYFLHSQEKKPTDDHPRGEVDSPPSMDSWSHSSYLHDQEKSRNGELGETSSAKVVAAREFFPLTPDLNGFLGTKKLGNHCPKIARAQPKRKFMASLTEDETFVEKKARYNRNQKEKKVASECEEEAERRNGISTELVLLFDPYKIKKKLTKSDLDHLSRLLIPRACVTSHVLPYMSKETVTRVKSSNGADVVVWDADMHSEHRLVFAFWGSSKAYVLKGCWIKEFVHRRGLAARDEIGIYWDPTSNRFHFSLLSKAN